MDECKPLVPGVMAFLHERGLRGRGSHSFTLELNLSNSGTHS